MGNGQPNGLFRIRSWSDVLAIAGLVGIVAGGVTWLLKLEGDISQNAIAIAELKREITHLRTTVNNGILPRADERIAANARRIEALERDIQRLEDRER